MYIEQLQKYKLQAWTYFPLPILFGILMFINYWSSRGIDTDAMIKDYINLLGVNMTFVALVSPLAFLLLVVLLYNRYFQNNSIRLLTTSRAKIDWNRILFSFFLWSGITVLTTLISYYAAPHDFVWNFNLEKFVPFFFLALVLIPMQTSFEEYLFRGHMLQGLGLATKTKWIPFLVTSFLFGIMHIANPEVDKLGLVVMIYYIGTGLFLGIVTLMDEGLELALGFHAANNLVGALLVTSDWTAFQTNSILKDVSEPTAGVQIIVPVFIVFPLLLFIFAKKYKWNNWKDKLFGAVKPLENN